MKYLIVASTIISSISSAPLLGGIAGVDASGWSILSPSADNTHISINKGFGNWHGPQYVPMNPYSFNPYGPYSGPQPYGQGFGAPFSQRSQFDQIDQAQGSGGGWPNGQTTGAPLTQLPQGQASVNPQNSPTND
jgi:hypothetical protein